MTPGRVPCYWQCSCHHIAYLRILWLLWSFPRCLQAVCSCKGPVTQESFQQQRQEAQQPQQQHSDSGHCLCIPSHRVCRKCESSLYILITIGLQTLGRLLI